jgi:hypothetical protein
MNVSIAMPRTHSLCKKADCKNLTTVDCCILARVRNSHPYDFSAAQFPPPPMHVTCTCRVRAHMGQHMGPEVRDRLSAQELQTAEQGGMDGKLLTIAQIRIMYYLTQQEAQEQAQSGAASRQAHSQHAGGGQQLPTQRSPSPAPPRQGQAGQKEAPPASRGRLTVAPWEVKGPIHRPGTAGKATRKA